MRIHTVTLLYSALLALSPFQSWGDLGSPYSMPNMVPFWSGLVDIPLEMPGDLKPNALLSPLLLEALNRTYPVAFLKSAADFYKRPLFDTNGRQIGDMLERYQEAYVCGSSVTAMTMRRSDGGLFFAVTLRGQQQGSSCYSSALVFVSDPGSGKLRPLPSHPWLSPSKPRGADGSGGFQSIGEDGALFRYSGGSLGILKYAQYGYVWNGRDYVPGRGLLAFRQGAAGSRIAAFQPDHFALLDIDGDGREELLLYRADSGALAVAGLGAGQDPAAEDTFLAAASPLYGFSLYPGMIRMYAGSQDGYQEEIYRITGSQIGGHCLIYHGAVLEESRGGITAESGGEGRGAPVPSSEASAPATGSALPEYTPPEYQASCKDLKSRIKEAEPLRIWIDWQPLAKITMN